MYIGYHLPPYSPSRAGCVADRSARYWDGVFPVEQGDGAWHWDHQKSHPLFHIECPEKRVKGGIRRQSGKGESAHSGRTEYYRSNRARGFQREGSKGRDDQGGT